jgi:6-pyruvoyltetrahydropterin/6-carboxytetrahydropterin synthase
MGSFKIGKQFDFCYGHRVWSQELNSEYSEDSCLACRHLHGHQGTIIVYLESMDSTLTNGMVTDFKHLGWFKKWVDNVLDHKFIMDINDPLFEWEFPESKEIPLDMWMTKHPEGHLTINTELINALPEQCLKEKYEGAVFVEFVPTSENLSLWLCKVINDKMNKIGVQCTHIQFFETPKSQSNYYF